MSKTAYQLFVLRYSPDAIGQYGAQALTRVIAGLLIAGNY